MKEVTGFYISKAKQTNSTLTEIVKLTVTYTRRPQVIGNQIIKKGGVLNLTCSVDSFPPSFAMWTKNVTGINPNNRTSFSNSTGSATVVISNMTVEDSGRYVCTATYMNNTVTEYVDIEVTWLPKVLNGSGCELQSNVMTCVCISEGFPLPTIKWPLLKDYTDYSIITMVSNHTVNSTVTVTVKTQDTSVACLSRNENGEIKENLTVLAKEANKHTTNSGKSSILQIIIVFFIGLLISPIIYCLFMKCYRKKRNNYGNVDESLGMVSPLMSLAAAPEPTSGPKELVYASIDFSLLNRIPRGVVKNLENNGTEYAEIKTNNNKEGDLEEQMVKEDSAIQNCVQEVKEVEEEAVYSTVEDIVNES